MIRRAFDRLPILALYQFRKVVVPVVVVTSVLLAALVLERLLRLVQVVTREGHAAGHAGGLIGYLVPHYLGLAIPAGLLIGAIAGIRGLHERSELVVMRAVGVPAGRLLRPVLALAGLAALLMALLTGWAQPHARHLFRERMHGLAERDVFAGMEAGVFREIGDDMVARVDGVSADGSEFFGFFFARELEDGAWAYLVSEEARRVPAERLAPDMAAELTLVRGVVVEERGRPGRGRIHSQLGFGEMPLTLTRESAFGGFGPRGRDERELTWGELAAGGIPGRMVEAPPAALRTELHARLGQVASLPLFGVLAVPLALIGRGRGARFHGLGIGATLFVLYEKSVGAGKAMAESGVVPPWVGIWVPWSALAVLAFTMHLWLVADRRRDSRP